MATNKKRGGPKGLRLTPGSKLKAAKMVVEGKKSLADVAKLFAKTVSPEEVKHWAEDYKSLDKTGFLARYGVKAKTASKDMDLTNLPVIINNRIVDLRARQSEIEAEIKSIQGQIDGYSAMLQAYNAKLLH